MIIELPASFVVGFVKTCRAHGLSPEETTELLGHLPTSNIEKQSAFYDVWHGLRKAATVDMQFGTGPDDPVAAPPTTPSGAAQPAVAAPPPSTMPQTGDARMRAALERGSIVDPALAARLGAKVPGAAPAQPPAQQAAPLVQPPGQGSWPGNTQPGYVDPNPPPQGAPPPAVAQPAPTAEPSMSAANIAHLHQLRDYRDQATGPAAFTPTAQYEQQMRQALDADYAATHEPPPVSPYMRPIASSAPLRSNFLPEGYDRGGSLTNEQWDARQGMTPAGGDPTEGQWGDSIAGVGQPAPSKSWYSRLTSGRARA